jgi:hypothetical protein
LDVVRQVMLLAAPCGLLTLEEPAGKTNFRSRAFRRSCVLCERKHGGVCGREAAKDLRSARVRVEERIHHSGNADEEKASGLKARTTGLRSECRVFMPGE